MLLNKEIDKSNDIISRFDEVMCDKASKFSLENLENKLKDSYLSTHEFQHIKSGFDKQCRFLKDRFDNSLQEIRQAKSDCYKQTYISMTKAANNVKNEIIEKLGGRPIDHIELQERLSLKADKRFVEQLDDFKIDKAEVENYNDMISAQNKYTTQLLGILIEYFQLTVPKGSIGENVPSTKRGDILKRTYNLFQAVNSKSDIYQKLKRKHRKDNKIFHINKPRSFSAKKTKKSVHTSIQHLVDIPVDTTPSYVNLRPLTSSKGTTGSIGFKKRKKIAKMSGFDKSLSSQTIYKQRPQNNLKSHSKSVVRSKNYSVLGFSNSKYANRLMNNSVEGKRMTTT